MTASSNNNCPEKYSSNVKHDRKLRKPLIEKRRRERINCSLEQLKGIMVDAYNLDQSKLEKADVLEVTVQHMEGLQKGLGAASVDGTTANVAAGFESRQRYSTGYIQCMHEVHNLLLSCPGMDKTLGAGLLNHLLKSLPHVSAADAAGAASPGSSPEREHLSGQRSDWSPNGYCSGSAISDRRHHHSGSPPHPGQLSYSSSPPSSPLSPETRSPFRPRRLEMHDPSAMPQAARRQQCCPQSPALLLPDAGPATEGPSSGEAKVCGVGDGSGLLRPPVSSNSPCFSPPHRASSPASPVGPAPSQVEDPSMWRPW